MKKILDILFPKKCIDCGKINGKLICSECLKNIRINKKIEYRNREVKFLISLFDYEEVRNKILKFKFYNAPYIYKYFLEIILTDKEFLDFVKQFDVIIPVPMFYKKKWKRGYNQSELIAKEISKILSIEYRNDILLKKIDTKTQSLLKYKERKINLKNAFSLNNIYILKGKNILIVDDIYTTGSTISECATILKTTEVSSVSALVIAKR